MSCAHHYVRAAGCESAFTVDASRITFGRGCLGELGERARGLGLRRVALFTDARVRKLAIFEAARTSLQNASIDVVVYDACKVEPTDASLLEGARFAKDARADGYVSLGGGSVIDTCKASNLYATCPADFLAYVNAPVGEGRAVPSPLAPHIACPTTSGTGSEVTGIAIFDLLSIAAKTGIASPRLRPTEALVDPDATDTLPSEVVAASGMDVLCHALESLTARAYTSRPKAASRPMSQGRNPWSDLGCERALALLGEYFVRAVADAGDREAREQVMWAATLAGIAFGNAGVHVPHAMAYAVAGLVKDYRPPGYPSDEPLVPHGVSVVLSAPAVFRFTAETSPDRHLLAARLLGADVAGAGPNDAGEVLAARLTQLMQLTHIPNGLASVGYAESDVGALVLGTMPQQRLLTNAPRPIGEAELPGLFRAALGYW